MKVTESIRDIVKNVQESSGEGVMPWDIVTTRGLSRAVLNMAFVDLLYKRYSNAEVVTLRNDARHFLTDEKQEVERLWEAYCLCGGFNADSLKDKAEQYSGAY